MKTKQRKDRLPRPQKYSLSASVQVSTFEGPWGMPMDSIRVHVRGSCMARPDHARCIQLLMRERERVVELMLAPQPATE